MELEKSGELVSITNLTKPPQELLDANAAGVKLGCDCAPKKDEGSRNFNQSELPANSHSKGHNIDNKKEDANPIFNNEPVSLKGGSGAHLDKMNRFRMIILMHSIENIPSDIDVSNKNYYIDFTVFGVKIRYKLDLVENAIWGKDPNAHIATRANKLSKFSTDQQ